MAGTDIATLGVASGNGAVLSGARFTQRTASAVFSSGGKFAGRSVEEVANALRTGNLRPGDVPIEYIVRDGKRWQHFNLEYAISDGVRKSRYSALQLERD
jgi:hypothetical protein